MSTPESLEFDAEHERQTEALDAMTDIQHYVVMTSLLRPFDAANDAVTPTFSDVVLFTGHLAAVQQVDQRWAQLSRDNWLDGYEQGKRDERAAAVQRVLRTAGCTCKSDEVEVRGSTITHGCSQNLGLYIPVIAAIKGDVLMIETSGHDPLFKERQR